MGGEPERDGEEQRRPLLSSSSSSSPAPAVAEQEQHQFLDRSSSSVQLHGGGLGCGGPEVSADEVRSATSFSSAQAPAPHGGHADPYPPSIHSAELSPPPSHAPSSPYPNEERFANVPQGPYSFGANASCQPPESITRDVLDEVEIRQLLIDHVGHRCCWGSNPARQWKITSIEDFIVYVGSLETFIEERDIVTKKQPYESGEIDGRDKGPVCGVWELDLRSEFPLLFIPKKEVMVDDAISSG